MKTVLSEKQALEAIDLAVVIAECWEFFGYQTDVEPCSDGRPRLVIKRNKQ